MIVSPAVAVIGAIGGYFVITNVRDAQAAGVQPGVGNPMPDGSSFWQAGGQPQTANGADHTASDWANVVGSVAKFGTSLVQFFGTSQSSGNDYSGGIGSNSQQVASYGNGNPGPSGDGGYAPW